MIARPTPERVREQPDETGGWSRFFDAALASLDRADRSEPEGPRAKQTSQGCAARCAG
jgi:hypothetical protein